MVHGQCLCGTVQYQVDGPFNSMMSCHCSRCRKHHGAAFATYVSAPLDHFRWVAGEDNLIAYQSSEQGGMRFACATCGSVVPILMKEHGLALLPAGPLEGQLGIEPQAHIFAASKAPWHTIADELPQHAEYPPEYAAPGLPDRQVSAKPGVTQGSCLCGEVMYEAHGDPLFMWNCHCLRCRRARSAAYGTNIFFTKGQFRWTNGEAQVQTYKLPEAKFYGTAFCKKCGAGVPRPSETRDVVVIPAGSMDTDPPIRALGHIYVGSKAYWVEISDGVPEHSEAPPMGVPSPAGSASQAQAPQQPSPQRSPDR